MSNALTWSIISGNDAHLELLTAEMDYISHTGGPSRFSKHTTSYHYEVENDHVSLGYLLRMAANMV